MPVDLQNLVWTDSETVCAQLVAFLKTPLSEDTELDDSSSEHHARQCCLLLLSHLRGAEAGELLARFFLDPGEHDITRLVALEELRWHGLRLPASCLERLRPGDSLWNEPGWPNQVCDYLSLLVGSGSTSKVRKYFRGHTPEGRALHQLRLLELSGSGAAELRGWLYRQWLLKDRERIDGKTDCSIWFPYGVRSPRGALPWRRSDSARCHRCDGCLYRFGI